MIDRKGYDGNGAMLSARLPVETILVALVASATVAIFALKVVAGGWEDPSSSAPIKTAGLRHEAMSVATSSDTQDDIGMAAADQDGSSPRSPNDGDRALKEASHDAVVRNGVTVLSPPLLVPVIDADALQIGNGAKAVTSSHKTKARKRSHYANRTHSRDQRRVVRSAPFWRIVAD